MLSRSLHCAVLLLGCAVVSPQPLSTQSTAAGLPGGIAVGGSVGAFVEEREYLASISLHVTGLLRNGPAIEATVSTFPSLFPDDVYAVAPDLSVGWSIPAVGLTLLPKAGFSGLVGTVWGQTESTSGYHLGAGVLIPNSTRQALRVDLLQHRYTDHELPIYSVRVGFARLPRRRT